MSTYWNFDKPVYTNKRYVAEFVKKFEGDCGNFAKNNIPNYDTISSLPNEFSNADYSGVTRGHDFFNGCLKISTFPNMDLNNSDTIAGLWRSTNISRIPYIYANNSWSALALLQDTPNLKIAELGNISTTEKLTSCHAVCINSSKLEEIITFFYSDNVSQFTSTFENCVNLTTVCKISTKRATTTSGMFRNTAIKGLEWEINLQCVTDVTNMFGTCPNLLDGGITLINVPKTLDLSKIGCATSKYTVKNNIETALDPSEVV